ncbi:alanine aminotransferase 2-like [Pygocentrus nattereri]|uniref:alanine transaminase n=1 Tax=Pygocentrus nattereri TaxID=42514 RepID=A0A3B4BN81_PYGNA|nr:alanine aminotransferase 2-like [Pygocentrus nattereri]
MSSIMKCIGHSSAEEQLRRRADAIRLQLTQGVSKPFKKIIDLSSGDIHSVGMKPFTFVRQVLAGCLWPNLLASDTLPDDARRRAKKLLENCDGGSIGAYAESSGLAYVQRTVAKFISARDGWPSNPAHIFIASGSIRAITAVLKLLAQGGGVSQTGVLIPVPFPYTLPRVLESVGSVPLSYSLREEAGWRIEMEELQRALLSSKGHCLPRAIYISNPGNPTGHVQSRESIQEVIQFVAQENLFLLVDEVYQDTVFEVGCEFVSYKKVLAEMGPPYSHTVQLASVHSLSNGIMGECGLRAGYMELVNVDESVMLFAEALLCGDISTPITGQIALNVMADPPKPGDPSHCLYKQEVEYRQNTLKRNMYRTAEFFNTLPGFHCARVQSGIFIYPRLTFSPEALTHAQGLGLEAGLWYCGRLLEEEGVCVGVSECVDEAVSHCQPGSSWHLRLCVLMPPDALEEVLYCVQAFHCRFLKEF